MVIRQFYQEVREHIKTDFNPKAYGLIFLLATIFLSINYIFEFEHSIIQSYYGKSFGLVVYILYYSIPYYLATTTILYFKKQLFKLKSSTFWLKSFLYLSIIGSFSALSFHADIADYLGNNPFERNYLRILFSNLKKIIPYLISLSIIYRLIDRDNGNFYGLVESNLSYKPFYTMLLLVFPLVITASFLPDFQAYYPRFKYWQNIPVYNFNKFEMNMVFLVCYAMDFISVELIFRGALVIGMVSILGREAVLPMALVYMVFHFGKPIGETFSSFFGGYILGVLSYRHKNIKGGIIVHIGLAWMMELMAILQHLRLNQ